MIRYINKTAVCFFLICVFSGCEKSLDIDPTSELESTYFQSEERIQRGVGSVYAAITNIYSPQLNDATQHALWLLPADDLTFDGTGNPFETFSGLEGSNSLVEGMWKRLYVIVGRCNFILNKIEDPGVSSVYENAWLKDANTGEMLFLRSWAYYKLWDWFRKAPIQDERITTIADAILPPSSGFEMLDDAITNLESAATLLPEAWDSKNLGRVTKDGAYGLLVKCYVLRACYNDRSTEDYSKAISAFTKISDSRQLVSFGENFDYRTENNTESLFEFQAGHGPIADNPWLDNDFGLGVCQNGAFYHMFDGHWTTYSSCIFGPTQKLINAFELGDPRMAETVSDSMDNVGGSWSWVIPQWDKFNGYHFVKYVNGPRGDCHETMFIASTMNNPRILRLADVKLAVAEAYLATGSTNDALIQVNDVRRRARQSTPDGVESPVPADLTSITMNDIMNERFVELAGEEGHRWTDLRRWHVAGYIDLGSWTSEDFGFPYGAEIFEFDLNKNLLYPIPTSELERNPDMAISGQNPGY